MKKLFLHVYNFLENYIHLKRIRIFLKNNIFLKDPIIFDVGSHRGKMSRLLNSIYKNASIYCFEPNKSFNKDLKRIGKNIRICNYALGNKAEYKNISQNTIDLTNSISKINKSSNYLKIKNLIIKKSKMEDKLKKIKVITLQSFCKIKKIKKIDFLKIDVEGYEYMVLLGAKNVIKNVKFVMIEIQKNDMYDHYSRSKIENFLKRNNFKLVKKFNFPFMFFQDCIYKKF